MFSKESLDRSNMREPIRGDQGMSRIRATSAALAVIVSCIAVLAGAQASSAASVGRTAFTTRAATTTPGISTNWSGYVVTAPAAPTTLGTPAAPGDTAGGSGESFTDVTGTWVQPKATCQVGATTASAFWVGLGGFNQNSPALEQIGTAANCSAAAKPSYNAWFEIVPAPSVNINLKILPGDTVTAAVLVTGQQVTLSLKNVTRHTRFSKKLIATGPLDVSSAEWIAEAPSLCNAAGNCVVTPLTNFGTVSFSKATTIAGGHAGTIADPAWQPTPLVQASGVNPFTGASSTSGAVPTDLSTDGLSFSVSWLANLGLTPGT